MSVRSGLQFARFLSRTGHRVIEAGDALWYEAGRGFFLGLPSHRRLTPSGDALRHLFSQRGCYGLRFAAPMDGPGKSSYQLVCDDAGYSLDRLSANNRSKVRRGLKRCEVRPLAFEEIARDGARADRDTLQRQGREARLTGKAWTAYWQAAADTPGMEGWGAFTGGTLASFLVTVTFDDGTVEYLLGRSRSDSLGSYPNNALIFNVTEEMLVRRGAARVTYGLESLEPVGPLDEFKLGMGFRRDPLRQRVVFRPALRRLLRPAPVRGLVHLCAQNRGAEGGFWRKATGLLRFAEEGGDLRGAGL